MSDRLDREHADQLAAITAGLSSLTRGAALCFGAGEVRQLIVEMDAGFLFVTSVSDGSCFAAFAAPDCDLGLIGYEMGLLVERIGRVLTPALRTELQAALPR
jgi:predicted regulator of Ras-like GTPase activity (Roadblock/LC7/MglB family)